MPETPVAYIIFNRPRHTEKTFGVLREKRVPKLFIIADGPRPGHRTDTERCSAVRAIVEQIDWPCEVHRNYSDVNLGCKARVISGLDWVFDHVESAIVLEDDCLPHPDFFTFCDALLDKYASDERVSVITGNNFQNGQKRGDAAYYFSKYNHVWGWATWRRAWRKNQSDLPFWPEWQSEQSWRALNPDSLERRYWAAIFDRMKRNEIDTWDYPWTASVWHQGGLTATPNVNLVTNIGFGPDGTHTVTESDQEGMPVAPLGPLTHPSVIKQDKPADRYVFDHVFGGIHQRWQTKMRRLPRRVAGAMWRRIKRAGGL